MWQRTMKYAEWQTPKQREADARITRQQDALRVKLCDALQFWRRCNARECKRRRACSGDPHACFQRHWALFSEDQKVWLRAGAKARGDGLSPEAAARAADAELERYVALMAQLAPSATAVPPAQQPEEAAAQQAVDDIARAEPRVRRL